MKLKFRLVNTADRAMRLNCLDKALLLERSGRRGSEAVLELDEWRFRYRGDAAKTLTPFLQAGLKIVVETDLEVAGVNGFPVKIAGVTEEVAEDTTKVGTPAALLRMKPRIRGVSEGTPGIELFGQLDLSPDQPVRTVSGRSMHDDAGAPFASGRDHIKVDDTGGVQQIRRLPHADGPLDQPPPRGTEPASTPGVVHDAESEITRQNRVLRRAAEMAAARSEARKAPQEHDDPSGIRGEVGPPGNYDRSSVPSGVEGELGPGPCPSGEPGPEGPEGCSDEPGPTGPPETSGTKRSGKPRRGRGKKKRPETEAEPTSDRITV